MTEKIVTKIKSILENNNAKLAVSESLTCGCIQKIIGQISGVSSFFVGGITTYSLSTKSQLLQIDIKHAQSVNCVSELVARQMAVGTCKLFAVNVSIATTGYAEPTIDEKVPFAYIAVKINDTIFSKKVIALNMERIEAQEYISTIALTYLLECLGTCMK
ncbi:CinA family protein [Candidatus Halobeggiatoa sp. HSG11]|nr:CinA family protein [Candidatus Halobeggiatoa sp. HSG11]